MTPAQVGLLAGRVETLARRSRGSSRASRSARPCAGAGSCRRATAACRGRRRRPPPQPRACSRRGRRRAARTAAARPRRAGRSSTRSSRAASAAARVGVAARLSAGRSRCVETLEDLLRRAGFDARCRQLERKRKVVEPLAERRQRIVGLEVGLTALARATNRCDAVLARRAAGPGTTARRRRGGARGSSRARFRLGQRRAARRARPPRRSGARSCRTAAAAACRRCAPQDRRWLRRPARRSRARGAGSRSGASGTQKTPSG